MFPGSRGTDGDPVNSKLNSSLFYICFLGGILSVVANNSRADYNIAIFGFLYIVSKHYPNLKKDGLYLLILSVIVDAIWIYFIDWKIIESPSFTKLAPQQSSVNTWTFWSVVANCGLKILAAVQLQLCS